ncbi:hypothetical protein [Portibacter lacus]|uniref:Uncharacterized protein n=1 Tax=Portibacter lacus TaxID=1099794 RepID=A0AA37SJH2_9BACT|nr:hypothetical protein [Portibacter lacus]GLR15706.1 hypothetical protein GCM10007940_03210 [Portibacter lacus]
MKDLLTDWKNLASLASIFVIVQVILAYFLGDAFWHPGSYVYTFGGDGSFIYYNMIFHTFFGNGMMLESMNFPNFESIFMTDAQAALSIAFSWIHDVLPGYFTPNKIVGWSHRFHYIMLGFASIYVYKTLELFKINKAISIPASILIILLSPMMIRLSAGHFGLAFPFVFSYTFFFLCQFYLRDQIKKFNVIAFMLVLLFFGLNNFYIGMINLTFSLLISIILLTQKALRKKGFYLLGISVVLIIALYLFIQLTDPGADRIEIQWGYFFNRANLASFLYPPTGILHELLSKVSNPKTGGFETWINLGIIPILILVTAPLLTLLKKPELNKNTYRKLFTILGIAGAIMFIYGSAALYYIPFLRDYFFLKISLLTMFKASARFAWPVYFIATILSMIYLNKVISIDRLSRKYVIPILLFLVFSIWGIETYIYLDQKVFVQMFNNPYSQETKSKMLGIVEDSDIKLEEFQALYSVPLMEGWNDKFHIVPHFNAEFNSILFSMSTGLPMINGMLSRIGITDASNAIQLSADPKIKRALLTQLDQEKDILIVFGKDPEKLTTGEKYLLNQSTLLADEKDFQLRRLTIDQLDLSSFQDSIISKFADAKVSVFDTDSLFFHYENFDNEDPSFSYTGAGSKVINQEGLLISTSLPDSIVGTYESSIWIKLDNHKYGMPEFKLDFLDQEGNVIGGGRFDAFISRDIHHSWVRASEDWTIPAQAKSINVYVENINQTFHVDEWTFRAVDSELVRKSPYEFLFNNYKLK